MVFSSMTFLCLALPLCLTLYYLVPRPLKNTWLLLFSLLFYAWGEPIYILLMLASIAINHAAAMGIERFQPHKKTILTALVALDIGLLIVYKYSAMLVSSANTLFGLHWPVPQIALPIGISFFTFQAMSYVIDVYLGQVAAQPRIDKIALYISLFPQLIAGPIVRYVDVAAEIDHRTETLEGFARGMGRFIMGLSKKVLIANAIAPMADEAFRLCGSGLSTTGAWIGIVSYALQIYFDFSGYSDMAIGLGSMFGFTFMENFNYPYISASIREFWNRWHISLSTWFRDYLYIPLGGNRVGKARHLFNIAAVFLCTGLWHGASWTFLIWGAYHGFFRIMEEISSGWRSMPKPVGRWATLVIVLIGWVIFRADTPMQSGQYLASMAGFGGSRYLTTASPRAILMLLIGIIGCSPLPAKLSKRASTSVGELIKWGVRIVLILLCMSSLASEAYNPFIYFRF